LSTTTQFNFFIFWILWQLVKWIFNDELYRWYTGTWFFSILDDDSLCKFVKVYGNEGAENLIFDFEMENIWFNLSKYLIVIWTFLKIMKIYCYNASETKMAKKT
jgi:hypothetical protein